MACGARPESRSRAPRAAGASFDARAAASAPAFGNASDGGAGIPHWLVIGLLGVLALVVLGGVARLAARWIGR